MKGYMREENLWIKFISYYSVFITYVGIIGLPYFIYKLLYYIFDYRTLIPFEPLIYAGMPILMVINSLCLFSAEKYSHKDTIAKYKETYHCEERFRVLQALLQKMEKDYYEKEGYREGEKDGQ